MINKIQIIVILLLVPMGLFYLYTQNNDVTLNDFLLPGAPVMRIGDVPIKVEIANSNDERSIGLSNREKFETASGLLFVFPETAYHSIWMKDMHFPIDVIWISEDLKVINIERNIASDSFPRTFRPHAPARYAVETNVHYADTFGLREGQAVVLPRGYLED